MFVLDAKPSKPVSVESIAQSIDQIKPTFSDEESGEDNSGDELLKQTNYLLGSATHYFACYLTSYLSTLLRCVHFIFKVVVIAISVILVSPVGQTGYYGFTQTILA